MKNFIEQIVKMLGDYESYEKIIVEKEEGENLLDVTIYGYFEYDEDVYNSYDIMYSLQFDKNGNLRYLSNRDKQRGFENE